MKNKIMKLFSIILFPVAIIICSCEKNKTGDDKDKNDHSKSPDNTSSQFDPNQKGSSPAPGDPKKTDPSPPLPGDPTKPGPSPIPGDPPQNGSSQWSNDLKAKLPGIKKYFQALPELLLAGIGGAIKQSVFIEKNSDTWVEKLGLKLDEKVVLVNAGNSSDDLGGGGIMEYITGWLDKMRGQKNFINHRSSNRALKTKPGLAPGDFSISDISGSAWEHFNACGVASSNIGNGREIKSIDEAGISQKNLYKSMLKDANDKGMEAIILCAISTSIFAAGGTNADGTSFTKDQFMAVMFSAAKDAIEEFKVENPGSKLKIIVNGFGEIQKVNL